MRGKEDMEKSVKKKSSIDIYIKRAGLFLVIAAVASATVPSIMYGTYFSWEPSISHERWAQFGDFLGGTLNPIFGFISLLAILITLFVQAKELSHSTEALQDQGESLKLQAFENTFFSLMRLSQTSKESLKIDEGDDISYTGVSAFRKVGERLRQSYGYTSRRKSHLGELEILKESYERFYANNKEHLDHYFRNFGQVVEFVKTRCPAEIDQYMKILSAQLSVHEQVLVFYHSACFSGYFDKAFLSEHGFFKDIPDHLLLKDIHESLK